MSALGDLWRTTWRLLTFRLTAEEFALLGSRHLWFGLACAWLVGIGRFWDNPRVEWYVHLGLGSVAYVFMLAALVWLVGVPLRLARWNYLHLATFISLTALPAILYAPLTQTLLGLDVARPLRMWALAIVSLWRVALLAFYLSQHVRAGALSLLILTLPLALIVSGLAFLNLEKVVFNFMGGVPPEARSAGDDAYGILILLTMLAYAALYLLVPIYLATIVSRWMATRRDFRAPRPSTESGDAAQPEPTTARHEPPAA